VVDINGEDIAVMSFTPQLFNGLFIEE